MITISTGFDQRSDARVHKLGGKSSDGCASFGDRRMIISFRPATP
jgi:hypothetical protein